MPTRPRSRRTTSGGRRRPGQQRQQGAGGEEQRRGDVALLLADARARRADHTGVSSSAGPTKQTKRTVDAPVRSSTSRGDVVDAGQHRSRSRAPAATKRGQQQPEVAGAARRSAAGRAGVPPPGCDRADRRVPGADVGADARRSAMSTRHRDTHHAVARRGRRPRRGSAGAGAPLTRIVKRQDRHPPGHQPGALVVGRRSSRPASRRRAPGRRRTPSRRRGSRRAPSRPRATVRPSVGRGEEQREADRERQPARAAGTGRRGPRGVDGAVADPAGDRVEHDVPRLGQRTRSRPATTAATPEACRSGRAAAAARAPCRTPRWPPTRARSRAPRLWERLGHEATVLAGGYSLVALRVARNTSRGVGAAVRRRRNRSLDRLTRERCPVAADAPTRTDDPRQLPPGRPCGPWSSASS